MGSHNLATRTGQDVQEIKVAAQRMAITEGGFNDFFFSPHSCPDTCQSDKMGRGGGRKKKKEERSRFTTKTRFPLVSRNIFKFFLHAYSARIIPRSSGSTPDSNPKKKGGGRKGRKGD